MAKVIKIKQGLDIKLKGKAECAVRVVNAEHYAIQPIDFHYVLPKLLVQEGEMVKAGTPLFHDKHDERIKFVSPVSGTVETIRRGEKRRLEAIVIRSDGKKDAIDFDVDRPLDKENIKQVLLGSGLWPTIRQRPYSCIANPDDMPKAFFISGFDTSPLAPDMDFIASHFPDSLQKGLDVLSVLTDGKVHLSLHAEKTKSEPLLKAKNVSLHWFSGPHPAGNIGTQINKIAPINKGETVWFCALQDVINIGRLFLSGRPDFTRLYALAGTGFVNPHYVRTELGASIREMTDGQCCNPNYRLISGNVLTGIKSEADGFIGFYHNMLTAIPEGNHREEMLGWMWPGFKKFSFSRTFPSAFVPNDLQPAFELDTNMHGEKRPFVVTGAFEKVFPFDIYPMQLIKACIVGDIDLMENLGIYEVDEEDFALCEFIDTSKNDIQAIIRQGLDLVRKEND